MADYLKTALLLEEKAAKLPLREPRRAYLLAIARAARLMGIEQLAGGSPEPQPGTLGKRAEVYASTLAYE
jgi:hypothetical protein